VVPEGQEKTSEWRHIYHLLAKATVGAEFSLAVLAAGLAGGGVLPAAPVLNTGPGPRIALSVSPDNTGESAQRSTHSLTPAQPDSSEAQHQSASDVQPGIVLNFMNGITQGHQENKTASGIISVIRNALGQDNVSEAEAATIFMGLVKKYAQKVLENLADDAIDDGAKHTADTIEKLPKKIVREFSQVLAGRNPATAESHISSDQIHAADSVLSLDADEKVHDLRDEVQRQAVALAFG
jgi:hypothetical protein